MSGTEAVMWAVEKDPALRSDFCNLTILDHAPSLERLHAMTRRWIGAVPRLGQRVVSAPLRLVPPEWIDDPGFDIDYHLRRLSLPAPGDHRALLDLVADLAEAPFDRSRPLWETTLVEGLEDGRAALLQKVHHTITDGVGGLRLSLAMVDFEPDPPAAEAAEEPEAEPAARGHSPLVVLRDAVHDAAARGLGTARWVAGGAGHLVTHPLQVPGRAGDAWRMVGSARRQLLLVDRAHSDVLRGRSVRRRFETLTVPLDAAKEAAHRQGGSLNDLLVTAVTGALGRYHARQGSATTDVRMAMPINTRTRESTAANAFTTARVLVPIVPDDAAKRFAEIHERLGAARREESLSVLDPLAGVLAGLPTSLLVALSRSQTRGLDVVVSNLRGSPVPLYLAGARIVGNYPFGPRAGAAVNVTLLSQEDTVHVGCNIDPAAVSDVPGFVDDLRVAFAEACAL